MQKEESGKEKVLKIALMEEEDMQWKEFERELSKF